MQRSWKYVTSGLAASLAVAAFYIYGLHARVEKLEALPHADPADVTRLSSELIEVETRVADSLAELARLRNTPERTTELDQRIATLQGELSQAAVSLSEQRSRIAVWDSLTDQIGPRALDERMEAYRRGVQDQWKHIDETAQSALGLAETTRVNLDHFEKGLQRDKDRMWKELVGPTVQLMGDETVGSGVLLRSEAVPGTGDFRTYLITAWHVIRDIQAGPENAHVPVPVTIYGQDRRISPETAELLKFDANIDVALLQLNSTKPVECGARLASRPQLDGIRIFDQVYAVGCPLGNDPIPTFGEIADTQHMVDGVRYWMISAPTYIGNSGGGIFDAQTHELLGIFSKIYTHGTMRPTVVPHMGLVMSFQTIYDWLETVGFASLEPNPDDVQVQAASAKR